jgi:hypothetical protein
MKSFALLSALAAAEIASAPPDTRGPYRDESGRIWAELPSPRDYPSFAAWDAEFAQEVFTARDGRRFQLDRELTPAELAENLALRQFVGALRAPPGSGSHLRATVTTHNPVDEEYRALYPSAAALKLAIRAEVARAEAGMLAHWGIDLVAVSGASWDSNDNADIVALLAEAGAEHGNAGLDMMHAWSADPTPGGAVGVGYLGLPQLLVKRYHGLEGNILEHELGHTYTLKHCCDPNCTMQSVLDAGALGNFHNYAEPCSGQDNFQKMGNQRNRY